MFAVKEVFSPGKGCRVKDWLVLSLLARPSRRLKRLDLLYESVAVFSLPVFSGGTILSAVFGLYNPQHVLAKYPPIPIQIYHEKEKNSNSIREMKAKYRFPIASYMFF